MASTLGTAWWFPTNASVDFPPPGGAPGPGSSCHFPNGLIGYGGTPTKNANSTPVSWNGFILSKDSGQSWFKGPNVLVATNAAHEPPAPSPAAGVEAGGGEGNPWAAIGKFLLPPIMWYDEVAKQTNGYWISPKAFDAKDGLGPMFRLMRRTTTDGLKWSDSALIIRNISMLELAKAQCTGLSGDISDNTTALGRCLLGGKSKNSQNMPGFNLTSLYGWQASFGSNGNTFTVMPDRTLVIILTFNNPMDIMQSNGRTFWSKSFGKDTGGGTDTNGNPLPGSDGPPFMDTCLRSIDRGKTFELINTDATLGYGRDKVATEHEGFTFASDADGGGGSLSAMGWTTEGELFASGVSNWRIKSAWSHE